MRILLLPNSKKDIGDVVTQQVISIISEEKAEIVTMNSGEFKKLYNGIKSISVEQLADAEISFAVTIGGDGTIIKAANLLLEYDIPIIGVNLGTLGFLAGIEKNELSLLRDVVNCRFHTEERMVLQTTVKHADGKIINLNSINDIVVSKNALSGIIELKITCDEAETAHYRCDGIIVSTALGSTAYAMSSGGPIIHPKVNSISITPICAHSLFARTIILPENETVRINTNANSGTRETFITADGLHSEQVFEEDSIEIKKYSKNTKFIVLNDKNFYSSVNNKLMER